MLPGTPVPTKGRQRRGSIVALQLLHSSRAQANWKTARKRVLLPMMAVSAFKSALQDHRTLYGAEGVPCYGFFRLCRPTRALRFLIVFTCLEVVIKGLIRAAT